MATKKPKMQGFEKALQELTQIVEQMEKGNLSLEESLTTFERGVKLTRECQQSLQDAAQKVQILTKENDLDGLNDFSVEAGDDDIDDDEEDE